MLNNHSALRHTGTFQVAELAQRADVSPATIRYYSRIGLLNPDRDAENGYRYFSSRDVYRVEFIRQAQALGLTIGDIKSIMKRRSKGENACDQVKATVEDRLISIRDQIADLRMTEMHITMAREVWAELNDPEPLDDEFCPLIERLQLGLGGPGK